jgi:hypothetical protein
MFEQMLSADGFLVKQHMTGPRLINHGLPASRFTHCQTCVVLAASVNIKRCSCADLVTCCSILHLWDNPAADCHLH